MTGQITDATSTFLEAAGADLQRQIARTGTVEAVRVDEVGSETSLIATIRINARTIEVRGSGENLLAAYAQLHRTAAASVLGALYVDYVDR